MKINCNRKQIKINQKEYIYKEWKEKDKLYLKELQKFFDRVDNIEDCELRQSIISQMLICDKVLTEIAEKMFNDFYVEGYKKAKQG